MILLILLLLLTSLTSSITFHRSFESTTFTFLDAVSLHEMTSEFPNFGHRNFPVYFTLFDMSAANVFASCKGDSLLRWGQRAMKKPQGVGSSSGTFGTKREPFLLPEEPGYTPFVSNEPSASSASSRPNIEPIQPEVNALNALNTFPRGPTVGRANALPSGPGSAESSAYPKNLLAHRMGKSASSGGPDAQKVPLPRFVKLQLHKQGLCEPCLYNSKQGCWYGDECRFCHFCTAEQIRKRQSRQYYLERSQRREREQHQQGRSE